MQEVFWCQSKQSLSMLVGCTVVCTYAQGRHFQVFLESPKSKSSSGLTKIGIIWIRAPFFQVSYTVLLTTEVALLFAALARDQPKWFYGLDIQLIVVKPELAKRSTKKRGKIQIIPIFVRPLELLDLGDSNNNKIMGLGPRQ